MDMPTPNRRVIEARDALLAQLAEVMGEAGVIAAEVTNAEGLGEHVFVGGDPAHAGLGPHWDQFGTD